MLISRHQGLTLIELIIIILIVSIVATVSYPNLSGIWHAQRANSQISTIEQTLHLARNHAINFGTQVTVCPIIANKCHSDWNKGMSVFIDVDANGQLNGADKLLMVINEFNANDTVQFNRQRVRFLSSGLSSGSNGTLIYCPHAKDNPNSQALIINNAERIRRSHASSIQCD